tara:strand:- start:905 stop:1081 length:177 start_codon:yes stop_codon:yes gene_type:complete
MTKKEKKEDFERSLAMQEAISKKLAAAGYAAEVSNKGTSVCISVKDADYENVLDLLKG